MEQILIIDFIGLSPKSISENQKAKAMGQVKVKEEERRTTTRTKK